jgi:hypothetical protein
VAFTGTPTVELVNDRTVRITGVQLIASATGTIGLNGATGTDPDIRLPATFVAVPYTHQGIAVPLTAGIQVVVEPEGAGILTNLPVSRAKTGTTIGTWRCTLTNTNAGSTTQLLEIYVTFQGGGRASQPAVVGP